MAVCKELAVFVIFQVLLFAVIHTEAEAPSTLRQVNILYRHGDRSPTSTFPTDPNQVDAWPQGWGQLSQQGMRQHYNLGHFFRQRYDGFINKTFYRREEIVIKSTDADRTLQSAYSDLAGMFPPAGYQIWSQNVPKWQPIPVHTSNKSRDTILRMDVPCVYYKELMDKTWKSPEVLAMESADRAFFDNLQRDTGIKDYNVSIGMMWKTSDPFICEKAHHKKWAPFMNNETYAKILYYHGLGFYYLFDTREKQKLHGGELVEQMVKNMRKVVDGDGSETVPKIFMYSSHDTTVAGFLSALEVYDKLPPPFACAVIVELHEPTKGNYVVKVFYKNNTVTDPTGEPLTLVLPGCDVTSGSCTLEKFLNNTKDLYPVDFNRECKNMSFLGSLSLTHVVIISVIGTALVSLIIAVLFFFLYTRRRRGWNDYRAAGDA